MASGFCFVIMPFKPQFATHFTAIYKPAIEKAGLECRRADSDIYVGEIMNDVVVQIREMEVGLALMTGRNPNVMYELGIAHCFSKAVILVSEKTKEDIPFDLRAQKVLLYEPDQPGWDTGLADQITRAIADARAKPAEAIPQVFQNLALGAHLTTDQVDRLIKSYVGDGLEGPKIYSRLSSIHGISRERVIRVAEWWKIEGQSEGPRPGTA